MGIALYTRECMTRTAVCRQGILSWSFPPTEFKHNGSFGFCVVLNELVGGSPVPSGLS